MLDGIVTDKLNVFGKEKESIKTNIVAKQTRLAKSRLIESADQRIFHFIFNTGQKSKISAFARKFEKLMDGPEELEEFEVNEQNAFNSYIDSI